MSRKLRNLIAGVMLAGSIGAIGLKAASVSAATIICVCVTDGRVVVCACVID